MTRFISNYFLIFFIFITFITYLIPEKEEDKCFNPGEEHFNCKLGYIDNIYKLVAYADSINYSNGYAATDQKAFLYTLNNILHERFKHGFSMYTFKDNFLLYIFSVLTLEKHRAIVYPEDILKHSNAACSQQAIVLQSAVATKNMSYRSVLLNGHFCTEVKIDDKWVFVDTNKELVFNDSTKKLRSATELNSSQNLANSYYSKNTRVPIDEISLFKKFKLDHENRFPAINLLLLHIVTYFFSHYGWILCIGVLVLHNWDSIKLKAEKVRLKRNMTLGKTDTITS